MVESLKPIKIVNSLAEMTETSSSVRGRGQKIGLVPTMGYLHAGHQALIEEAARVCDFVIVSIFVNPLQFGPGEDLERYPRNIERDMEIARQAGAGLLFVPAAADITPLDLMFSVDPGPLKDVLCGQYRPGHFEGVCTIVLKLLHVTRPDFAIFGWKDAQQFVILRKMVQDLNVPVELAALETIREPDGLALSSRNAYLNEDERGAAPAISRELAAIRDALLANPEQPVLPIIEQAKDDLNTLPGLRVQYIELTTLNTLRPLAVAEPGNSLLAAAVFAGSARLIDNVRF